MKRRSPGKKRYVDEQALVKPRGENLDQGEIHIAIDTMGNIILETLGTKGNQCDLLAGALEVGLGKIVIRTNKECYADDGL